LVDGDVETSFETSHRAFLELEVARRLCLHLGFRAQVCAYQPLCGQDQLVISAFEVE
jgi:hypothetical protein